MKPSARIALVASGLLALAFFAYFRPGRRPDLWQSPDRRGDALYRTGKFVEAAKNYREPNRQGAASYRARDFQAAAAAFGRDGSAAGAYNRGNSLVMLGKYADAVKSYDRALELHPGWKEAEENRALAAVRRDRMDFQGGDAIGGEIKPDQVVVGRPKSPSDQAVQVDAGKPLSDQEIRSTWLRRVQTKPADFLRAKFAYQLQDRRDNMK